MTVTSISRKALGDLVEARAKTLTGVTVYRGEVTGQPPLIQTNGQPDASGRVAPHIVIFASAGTPTAEVDLAETTVDLRWWFQLTCVAGYEPDCTHLIDRVDAAFYRWSPTLPGLAFGMAKPPLGFDPGPVRPVTQVSPPRFWLPLQYVLPVTT